ncbi:lipopolysaccharide-induced tumor necrosis factor-alpha factor isoform X4 [Hippoglossus stenolepis]|uniref:lipopolysaccharide-induced tumor necrosis factor-alpha factor isoform X4 n=1 Tax=Hippoglossus stenolepis TaxID=195615 RepID=UPI001FAFD429|nr:lipopolysaccharide-induced tumor necrosis factor-alpha factor isoform X4 [Hippoglossus stenolepis]
MEMGQGVPPPMTDIPAPPYPGPPAGFDIGGYEGGPPPPAVYSVQQPGYQYSQQQPQIIQSVNQVVVVQNLPTEAPGHMICPHCQITVLSHIKYKNGMLAWLICGLIGLVFWPGCFIPFFVDACKDVEHSCPLCHTVLHVYKRI